MGNLQSDPVRQSHFQRPDADVEPDEEEEPHINISNKIVERLVEDATLAESATARVKQSPRGDYRDKIYMEKLRCMDENHSERYGLTVEDLNAMATRIELRTANMVSPEPVCADCKQNIIECYNACSDGTEVLKCWDTVNEFRACVHNAAAARLRARSQKDARDRERRNRHVLRAREHALRDITAATVAD